MSGVDMPMSWFRLGRLVLLALGMCQAEPLRAEVDDADPKGLAFFEAKIRPVLVERCYECHSARATKVKGGLLLDSRDGLLKGGKSGVALIQGKPEQSLLIQALKHEGMKMPPQEKLSDEVIAHFVEWVTIGAPDPRRDSAKKAYKTMTLEEARRFWSFQPPRAPTVPKVGDERWPLGDVDRFIQAKLESKGLRPVAPAEPRALLRRLYFDLIGLPPEPQAVEDFVKAPSPQALEKVVDGLLQSPHFGERWGRHWLDLARYAESNGSMVNHPFPNAWRYRDYVIRAFNQDKAYDRFIHEQIAGDLLNAETPEQRDELLIATGFLALTCKPPLEQNPNFQMDLVADQIDVTSRAFLGLSVLCARCHDHKFDPIPTRDYYALAGIFSSSTMLYGGREGKGSGPMPKDFHILSDGSFAMGVRDNRAADAVICIGGDSRQRGKIVPRGFLQAASNGAALLADGKQSGRLELAQWLTRSDNPLTARVAVNRVWQHLFGRGLVPTTDNFGSTGQPPSHPELLDYLALRFMNDGWSVKKLIRTLVLSQTYRLSSRHDARNHEIDPDNTLLWRMSRRRLEAEALRDAMLAVSGKLLRQPPQGTFSPLVAKSKNPKAAPSAETNHRSVYLGIDRGAPLPEMLQLFDGASPNLVVSQRDVTTVAGQAVFLLNSPFVAAQAQALRDRVLALPGLDRTARIDAAFMLAFGRPAEKSERERALAFLVRRSDEPGADNPAHERAAWAGFCHALLAAAEFRYLQ